MFALLVLSPARYYYKWNDEDDHDVNRLSVGLTGLNRLSDGLNQGNQGLNQGLSQGLSQGLIGGLNGAGSRDLAVDSDKRGLIDLNHDFVNSLKFDINGVCSHKVPQIHDLTDFCDFSGVDCNTITAKFSNLDDFCAFYRNFDSNSVKKLNNSLASSSDFHLLSQLWKALKGTIFFDESISFKKIWINLLESNRKPTNNLFESNDKYSNLHELKRTDNSPPDMAFNFPKILWIYALSTYAFSIIVYYYVYIYTMKVLKTRQKYLALQNSITDRTIRIDHIPHKIIKDNDPNIIKRYLESLGIGKVDDVKLVYDWTPLRKLFIERKSIIQKLEIVYATNLKLDIEIYNQYKTPQVNPKTLDLKPEIQLKINNLALKLRKVDDNINDWKSKFNSSSVIDYKLYPQFRPVPSAFVTMDSVASAQMAAQTVLDPRAYKLIVSLAPSPKDIIWENFKLSYLRKKIYSYLITTVIILSYGFIIFLVTPLTTLLDLKTLTKLWPSLGKFVAKSALLTTFVTGILPPLLFSLLNMTLPYFYQYLSTHQGYKSNSDVELSTLSKNFFYIFFNLFLVFIITGTIWDYLSYISDTTKIAYQLAKSLKKLSLFYVNLILLQGLAMFPVKLLQLSDFLILNIFGKLLVWKSLFLRTPREYRSYYFTPLVFDFGIQLPQHLLIFIIILIYSVVNTKIVLSGAVYFSLGLLVYKYQLVYNFVHPPHSTGKVWIMIFRRITLALIIFQLFMCGTLALEKAFFLSAMCSPLILFTFLFSWNFDKYYLPLSNFIALKAILNPKGYEEEFAESAENSETDDTESSPVDESSFLLNSNTTNHRRRPSTVDEEREQYTDYTYPELTDPLYGPWIGFEGDYISMVQYNRVSPDLEDGDVSVISSSENEIVLRKRLRVSEWE